MLSGVASKVMGCEKRRDGRREESEPTLLSGAKRRELMPRDIRTPIDLQWSLQQHSHHCKTNHKHPSYPARSNLHTSAFPLEANPLTQQLTLSGHEVEQSHNLQPILCHIQHRSIAAIVRSRLHVIEASAVPSAVGLCSIRSRAIRGSFVPEPCVGRLAKRSILRTYSTVNRFPNEATYCKLLIPVR